MSTTEIYACKKNDKRLNLILELKNSWLVTPIICDYYGEKYKLEGSFVSATFIKEFDKLFNSGGLKDRDEYFAGLYYQELYMNKKMLKELLKKLDDVIVWAEEKNKQHNLCQLKESLKGLMKDYDYFLVESSLNCVSEILKELINMETYLKKRNYQTTHLKKGSEN